MKILLLDLFSLAHQIPKTMHKLTTTDGTPSGHVYSWLKHMKEVNNVFEFDSIVFVIDGGHVYRSKVSKDYKANRGGGFLLQMGDIIESLSYLPGISVYSKGFEADDLIYTICKFLDVEITILSKDYDIACNLVFPNVKHYLTSKEQITELSLFMKLGCSPAGLPLYKAIFGDSSDNIKPIKLDRKSSSTIKQMFIDGKSVFEIGKAIPRYLVPLLLTNLKLTKPIEVKSYKVANCGGLDVSDFLNRFSIKSLSPSDVTPKINTDKTKQLKKLLLNG